MPELYDSKYFSGQGPLYIGSRDANGKSTGLTFVGDIESAELSANVETEEVIENVTGTAGVGSSFQKSVDYSLAIVMRSIKAAHLKEALQAGLTAKTGASVTDEAHNGYHDKFIPLLHNKVSAVVVTNDTGVTTYVADTDYVLGADRGMIEILSTGSITDGQALLIDYTYAQQDHLSAAPANTEKYLVFAGINRADNNKQTRCEMYKVKLDPSALGLIQDTHATLTLNGKLLLDSLRPAGDQFYSWKIEA